MLAKICGSIASDEGRHEIAYQRIVEKLYEKDPDGAVLAFADMMRKQIVMPAHLMDDGEHSIKNPGRNLFAVGFGPGRSGSSMPSRGQPAPSNIFVH